MKKLIGIFLLAVLIFTGCGSTDTSTITVVSREDGSGTRGAFVELLGILEKDDQGNKVDRTTEEAIIVNKTDVMLANIANDPNAIGYVSLGSLNSNVKAVTIDGVEATAENIKNQTYQVSRPFNIVYKDTISEVAQDFIKFILSSDGQEVIASGYIAVNEEAEAYLTSSMSGKIVIAGSSSVSPIMEKLAEAYQILNPNVTIEIQTNDSTSGVTYTIDGICDIGMVSRDLKDTEASQLTGVEIALDGIAIIVNKENPVSNLTQEQVKEIFTGVITSWSDFE